MPELSILDARLAEIDRRLRVIQSGLEPVRDAPDADPPPPTAESLPTPPPPMSLIARRLAPPPHDPVSASAEQAPDQASTDQAPDPAQETPPNAS